ncbi:dihydroxyacetone kinase subunit DhaL [Clostridium polynesiense]|uniref:dihydroxyacetone kinase subunit DhaL n=1 Tax=Clostridium polynesiense TaxID=1325933 RepID=UPI00058E297D|nr:dihydroxyacetone kinase subunit DhaL [Clostridium polynesiense]
MSIDVGRIIEIFNDIAVVIGSNKEYLTDLDAAIGDGDHGINLNKGFQNVVQKLSSSNPKDIGEVLKIVGMTLISTVGGASGALYGTAFMKAQTKGVGKEDISLKDFSEMLNIAVDGIKMRGKGDLGDKTMLDVLIPVSKSIEESLQENRKAAEAFRIASETAFKKMEDTKNISAKKGRASYLGERSIGHIDPGAASSYLIIKTIGEYLAKEEN